MPLGLAFCSPRRMAPWGGEAGGCEGLGWEEREVLEFGVDRIGFGPALSLYT
jgi:hypothetical protein